MLLALILLAATPTDDTPVLLKQLNKAVNEGRWGDAATLTRTLERTIAAKAPLLLSEGHLLRELPQALGIYEAIADGVVSNQELVLYVEVHEHGVRKIMAGYELDLASDLVVLDAEGHEIARDDGFGEQRIVAKSPHRDTFVTAALSTKGLPAGRYVARWIIHDRVGDKTASIDIPFAVAAKAAP